MEPEAAKLIWGRSVERLHNTIWNFCPKAKYNSPQSVRISTAVAVSVFNEAELCLYGFMRDLKLNTTPLSFRSVCKRDEVRQQSRRYFKKANVQRRGRRLKLSKLRREFGLLRKHGESYKSSSFEAETFITPSKPRRIRGSRPRGSTNSRATTSRGKGRKRRLIPTTDSDDPDESNEPEPHEPHFSGSDFSHSDEEVVDITKKDICGICNLEHPPPSQRGMISKYSRTKWLQCAECDRPYHQRCTEDSSYICYLCT